MNYHQIKKDDMNNGEGLRVTVFLSGCDHHCHNCHNPQTWNRNSGQPFDEKAEAELFAELEKDYVSGVTFSGGDPLNDANVEDLYWLCVEIKKHSPNKTIWIYTGYTLEEIYKDYKDVRSLSLKEGGYLIDKPEAWRVALLNEIDVLVDGKFEENKADVNYPWAGSTNQRVIDMKKTMSIHKKVLETNGIKELAEDKPLDYYIQQIVENPDKNIVLYESK